MYDILILSGKKDLNKIKYVYESIISNLSGFNNIYCVCQELPKDKIDGINYYQDEQVLNVDFDKFLGKVKSRKSWYKQQYIKLLQQITIDNYLVVDSDVIFNRNVDIIENNKPTFLLGRDQIHKPYFEFNNRLFGFDRLYNHSFINEVMYFKREIIQDIFNRLGVDDVGFFNKTVEIINDMNEDAGMSEYEMYGNYVYKYFKNDYNYKKIKTLLGGKHSTWLDSDIEKYINDNKDKDYDIISMHSWI